jgi:hypothetical protein
MSRNMSVPSDNLNAFAGVQTELGDIFTWTFTNGLPLEVLDLALLWTPCRQAQKHNAAAPELVVDELGRLRTIRRYGAAMALLVGRELRTSLEHQFRGAEHTAYRTRDYLHVLLHRAAAIHFVIPSVLDPTRIVRGQEDPALPTEHLLFDSAGRGCGILVSMKARGICRTV